jgi:hypothetical protein
MDTRSETMIKLALDTVDLAFAGRHSLGALFFGRTVFLRSWKIHNRWIKVHPFRSHWRLIATVWRAFTSSTERLRGTCAAQTIVNLHNETRFSSY